MTPGTMDFRKTGAALSELLGLENPPIAVAFLDTPPPGLEKNEESAAAGCVFWIRAFRTSFYTDRADHANCNIGSYTHGFLAPQNVSLEKAADIKLFQDTGYFPVSEFGSVPRMTEPSRFVAYGPLEEATFGPDVVLIVCTPSQAMLVAEAADSPKMMGAPTCGAIPFAFNEGRVGISLGCVTNRIRTGIKPSEMVVTIPRQALQGFTERLRVRVEANQKVADAVTSMLSQTA